MIDAEEVLVWSTPCLALRECRLEVIAEERLRERSVEDVDGFRVLAPKESEVLLEILLQSEEGVRRRAGRFEVVSDDAERSMVRLQSVEDALARRL